MREQHSILQLTFNRRIIIFFAFLIFYLPIHLIQADDSYPFEPHGFISQGFIHSTDNNYLVESRVGSFEFTEAGFNITHQLTDKMRTGVQLFARQLGPTGNFNAKIDWFYFDYHAFDSLGFRFGRLKLPFGLYNDSSDIDSARTPILLPQSIYPTQNRDFLLAQNGMEAYGYSSFAGWGALDYRLYGGTIYIPFTNIPGATSQIKELSVPYVVGSRILWETPLEGLRVGGSIQALKLDGTFYYNSSLSNVTGQIPALLWVGSAEYSHSNWLLSTEYSRWYVKTGNSNNPAAFPGSSTTSERAYAMASYRANSWFQPGLYHSIQFSNVESRTGRQSYQHDLAATLRFDINRFWLVKLEGHLMKGTAGLNTTLNNGTPLKDLKEDWGVLAIKTTAYF